MIRKLVLGGSIILALRHLFAVNLSLLPGSDLVSLTQNTEYGLSNYEDILFLITCDDVTIDCKLGLCKACPKKQFLQNFLLETLRNADVKEVRYKQWISKPRTTLESQLESAESFAQKITEHAVSLLRHSFIAKEQSRFLRFKKENLPENEVIVICDFAENYAFVVQDAAPGFHWNNNQATIYPVVVYFMQNGILSHRSMAIISDCMHHDSVCVYAFSKLINAFVRTLVPRVAKFSFFSDGAPQQFKNFKNFSNIYYFQADFSAQAEWHYFATAHGKGPCDGIGGTIKRLASRASLQLSAEKQIITAKELYNWASTNIPSVKFFFYEDSQYETDKSFLQNRYTKCRKIKNTHQIHSISSAGNNTITTKLFSFSQTCIFCKLY